MNKKLMVKNTIICFLIFTNVFSLYFIYEILKGGNKNIEIMYMSYGDKWEPELLTSDNQKVQIQGNGKYRLIYYLDRYCSSCLDILPSVSQTGDVLECNVFDYCIVWEDKIPLNLLEKYKIPKSKCYSTGGKYRLSPETPTIFLVDDKDKVIFKSSDLNLAIEKLLSITMPDYSKTIRENANNILSLYFTESNKEKLVYFTMNGCPDCQEADQIIANDEIMEKYEILRVYRSTDDHGLLIDHYSLLQQVYDIKWYPSFVLIDKDKIIGQTPLSDLKQVLLGE